MKIIDGLQRALDLRENLAKEIKGYMDSHSTRAPKLVVVLVGDDPASHIYVSNKEKACAKTHLESETIRLPADTSQTMLESTIKKLNSDTGVDGILLQLPLPGHLDSFKALQVIHHSKDVDGLTPYSQGLMYWNKPGLRPCTPAGIMHLLEKEGVQLQGKRAAVIGRSILVGGPIAVLMQHKGATVTILHSKTQNKEALCKEADVLVVAAGKPHLVDENWVKPGAVVIDVGIHRDENNKIIGDVAFDRVKEIADKITPVPKGVGPMTIAMLLANTFEAYKSLHSQNH